MSRGARHFEGALAFKGDASVSTESGYPVNFTARWQTMTLIPETAWKTEML